MDNATKQQLKKPDQFVTLTEHGLSWASRNRRSAIVSAAILLVVILAAVGGFSLYQHRSALADNAFGAAMQTYQTPIATPGQQIPPGTKTFASQSERAAAANTQFVSVANQYGLTRPGRLASYFAGLTYMEEGQNASAETLLKKTASSWDKNLAALGKESLAQLYQQTGRDSQAKDLYNELAKMDASTVPSGLAKIELAEMYEAEGNPEQAKKIYAEIKDKDKDPKGQPGPAAELATEKLNPKPAGPAVQQ